MNNKQLLIFGVLCEICYLAINRLADWDDQIPLFLSFYFLAFLLYALIARRLLRHNPNRSASVRLVLIFAVLFRLTLLFNPPSLSEDFYRYVWDGRVQMADYGPYDHAPRARELQYLRDQNYEKINHAEFKTIYPPAAQLLFRFLAWFQNLSLFKLGILLFDLLLIEVLRRLAVRENLPPSRIALYAWHPLAVIEFAGSAHIDVVALSLLFATILLFQRQWKFVSGALLGAAVLVKYLPLVVLPWLIRKGSWKVAAGFLVTVSALFALYYTPDLRMFDSLFLFYRKWRFNDSLFGILYNWAGGAEPARRLGAFFVLTSAAFAIAARFSIYRSLFFVLGAIILFSPVVHPWYLCWIIPFLVFHPNGVWLFFTGWVALAYLVRHYNTGPVWQEFLWIKLLIYVPFYLLLLKNLLFEEKHQAEGKNLRLESIRLR